MTGGSVEGPRRPSTEFSGTDRYRVIRRLGHGSMGVVYEAQDEQRGIRVALKTIRTAGSDALYRLKREFRRLVDLDHPNLVTLYDLVVTEASSFFTMELVRGVDFGLYCRRQGALADEVPALNASQAPLVAQHDAPTERLATPLACDEVRLRHVLPQLVEGIRELHLAGKLHRDIKPSNVLVTEHGQVKLLDFGLVVDLETIYEESVAGGIVGTVAYMSPEQAAGGVDLTPASDWYSVGVLVYGALTGRLPFGGEPWQMVVAKQERPAPPPRQVVPGVPEDLDDLCVRLLKRRPDDRPTAEEILDRLGRVPQSFPGGSSSPSHPLGGSGFTGRTEELARLERALASARQGRATAVLVSGASGMGKSALVQQFIARSRRQDPDVVVLEGRCFERESVPYQAVDNLIDDFSRVWHRMPSDEAAALLPLDVTPLVRLFPVLGRVSAIAQAPAGVEVQDPQERRTRGFAALREVFHRLGRRQAMVLFLDDMQWVDADTVTLLTDILRPPEPPPLLLLLTARADTERSPQLEVLMSNLGPTAERIDLSPLPFADAAQMARGLLGPTKQELADRIAVEASGSPFFVAELARYATGAEPGAAETVAVDNVVQERISELSSASRTLLELLALAGEPLSVEVATTAAGTPAASRERTVRSLRRRSLLRKAQRGRREAIEIYHDRFRLAIISQLPDAAIAAHHRVLAVALQRFGEGTAAQLARHWRAAGDWARSVEHTRRAAEEAVAALAFDRAAAFYFTALEVGDFEPRDRREIELALAAALARAARGPEAAALYTQIARTADGDSRMTCEKRAAAQWLISGHVERGLEAVDRLLGELGGTLPRSPWRALVSILVNRFLLRCAGLKWRERRPGELSEGEATRLDVYRAVSHGVGLVDPIRGADFQARLLRLSLRTGEPVNIARALFSEANYRATQGPKNRPFVERLLNEGRRIADRLDDGYLIAFTFGSEGFVHYYFSEFHQAYELLSRSDEMFSEKTVDAIWERNTIRLVRLWSLLRMARFGELRQHFDRYVREASRGGDLYTETTLRRSMNRLWLVAGDVAGARADLARTSWSPPEGRFHLQHWYSLRAEGELALYEQRAGAIGARDGGFQALDRSMLTRVQFIRTEARWLRARLLLGAGQQQRGAERLGRYLRRMNVGYARVWGLLVLAGVAQQRRRDEQTVALLRAAVTASAEQNMNLCLEVARHRLGRLMGGTLGGEMVADAQRGLEQMGVADAEAMMNVMAPGFS